MTTEVAPKGYSVRGTAKALDLSVATVYRLIESGRLGYVQVTPGGKIIVPTFEIDEFLQTHLKKAVSAK